jgi:creatinine amidohydrolase
MTISEYRMQEMTWYEIADAMQRDADTVIIVATAQEQHAPHLPMATDWYWGAELARRVALGLNGRALIAPIIPFGPNEEMMGFPGTVSLRAETLIAILRDLCESYARHGFRNAVLLTSHEGDFAPLAQARRELTDLPIHITAFDDMGELVRILQHTATTHGVDVLAAGAHAGEFETSLMLAAYPHLVRHEKVESGLRVDLTSQPDFFRQNLRLVTPNGMIGDATKATAEQGEHYWQALTQAILDHLSREGIAPR